jgi:hypothetical protein
MNADRIIHAIIGQDKAQPTVQGVSLVVSYVDWKPNEKMFDLGTPCVRRIGRA